MGTTETARQSWPTGAAPSASLGPGTGWEVMGSQGHRPCQLCPLLSLSHLAHSRGWRPERAHLVKPTAGGKDAPSPRGSSVNTTCRLPLRLSLHQDHVQKGG